MLIIGIFVQHLILALVILTIAFLPIRSKVGSLILIGAGSLVLLGFALAGVWVYPPAWFIVVFIAAFLAAGIYRLRKHSQTPNRPVAMLTGLTALIFSGLGALTVWQGISGRLAPAGDTIDLASPLSRDNRICVLSGGNSVTMNLHFLLKKNPMTAGETHAIDFVRKNHLGFRTTPDAVWIPRPSDPSRYLIFSEPVQAPCNGTVLSAVNDRPDVKAGSANRDLGGSNYVALLCEGTVIIMAHLKQGSIQVEKNQNVRVGDAIGQVGNSGNTEEPHLHINAQTYTSSLDNLYRDSQSLPITIDGRYMSRGDCL